MVYLHGEHLSSVTGTLQDCWNTDDIDKWNHSCLPQCCAVIPITVAIEETGPWMVSVLVMTVHGSCFDLCIQTEMNVCSANWTQGFMEQYFTSVTQFDLGNDRHTINIYIYMYKQATEMFSAWLCANMWGSLRLATINAWCCRNVSGNS